MRRHRTDLALVTALAVTGTVTVLPAASAAVTAGPPAVLIEDNRTQPVFSFADAIYQVVNIETTVDSDGDGVLDTVQMRLKRPAETAAGLKVPVIIEPGPYHGTTSGAGTYHPAEVDEDGTPPAGGNGKGGSGKSTTTGVPEDARQMNEDRDADTAAGKQALMTGEVSTDPSAPASPEASTVGDFETWVDNYFVPRGYAVADVDSIGTNNSTGCPSVGGPDETAGIEAAVDWLNGRAKGWDIHGDPVTADWSTGDVALKGKSYDGTLPLAVATTGVEGLKTVVAVEANTDWYHYLRFNGGVIGAGWAPGYGMNNLGRYIYTRDDREICAERIEQLGVDEDRVTGDRNAFWDERDYIKDVDEIKASVFVVQGLRDVTVKPVQATELWEELQAQQVPSKLWLFPGVHLRPISLRADEWVRQMHAWYDHSLYGIDNGIMDEPKVDIQREEDQSWHTQDEWPAKDTDDVTLHLNAGESDDAPGVLSQSRGTPVVQSLTDIGRTTIAENLVTDPDTVTDNRLAYLSPVLTEDLRVSGQLGVELQAALDGSSPYFTAMLVDYFDGTGRYYSGNWAYDTTRTDCFGEATEEDPGCSYPYRVITRNIREHIVQRGWLDARNRNSEYRTDMIRDGNMYKFNWDIQPTDHVFKAGHRIGIVLISTDHRFNLRYQSGTDMSVKTALSSVDLPVVGGENAWQAATTS